MDDHNVKNPCEEKNSTPNFFFPPQKRKAEAEPSEKEREDKVSEEKAEETKKEEEAPRTMAEPVVAVVEEKKEEATLRQTQAKRPKSANPYGVWEQIQVEEDPL